MSKDPEDQPKSREFVDAMITIATDIAIALNHCHVCHGPLTADDDLRGLLCRACQEREK